MATHSIPRPAVQKHYAREGFFWALQIGIALMFLKAGIPKLNGDPMAVQAFAAIGLGQWFRYLTGILEITGSVGLLIPALAGYAALLLSVVMAGAILAHLLILGGSPLIAVILLVANLVVVWGRLWRK